MKKTYFITGVSGFLGEEIMTILAGDRENRIYCLIRGQKELTAQDRLRAICRDAGIAETDRISAIEGDIGKEGFGLSSEIYENLASEVTHIIHSAADVRFNQTLDSIRKTNVGGTRNIIMFTRHCKERNPRFSHLAYVGTSFVAGKRRGLVGENDLTGQYGFKNTYEQSKFEAESLLRENMSDIPVVIYRPSIIVGLSESGKAKPRNVIYPMLRLFLTWNVPAVPLNTKTRLDIVPVDFVARSIVHISSNEENIGKCFPLVAGPEGTITLPAMLKMVKSVFNKNTRVIPSSVWRMAISPVFRRVKPGLHKKVKRVFNAFEPYVWELSPQYSPDSTRRALEGSGIDIPDARRFIMNCFMYANETNFGELDQGGGSEQADAAGVM